MEDSTFDFEYRRLDTPPPAPLQANGEALIPSIEQDSEKLRNRESLTRRLSSNFKLLEETLQSTHNLDKSSVVQIFEIESGGRSSSREIGIRSLTNYINLIIHMIDQRFQTNAAPLSPVQNKSDKMPASPKASQNKDDSSLKVVSTQIRSPLTSMPSQYNPLVTGVRKRHSVHTTAVAPGITIKSNMSATNLQALDSTIPIKQGFDISVHKSQRDSKRTISTDQHSKLSAKLRGHVENTAKLKATAKHDVNSRLSARDMRRLDYLHNPSMDGLLLIREHCILLSVHPIRCVVMAERIIVIVPPESAAEQREMFLKVFPSLLTALADYSLRDVDTVLSEKTSAKDEVPFEFHCLEMVLTTVHSMYAGLLGQMYEQVKDRIDTVTRMTEQHELVITEIIEDLKVLSAAIDKIHTQISTVHRQLDEVADDEEDLALINLTVLSKKPSLYVLPLRPEILKFHERSEELLEVFLIEFNTHLTSLKNMQQSLKNAKEKFNLYLDTVENKVLIVSVLIGLLACCISFSGVIAGAFGMNLNMSMLKKIPFAVVFPASFFLIIVLFLAVKQVLIHVHVIPAKIVLSRQRTLYL